MLVTSEPISIPCRSLPTRAGREGGQTRLVEEPYEQRDDILKKRRRRDEQKSEKTKRGEERRKEERKKKRGREKAAGIDLLGSKKLVPPTRCML